MLELVDEAMAAGARQYRCCEVLRIPARTLQRWRQNPTDRRKEYARAEPANKLTREERALVKRVACSPRFRDVAPKQIVAMLADEGVYIASESTFYRVLRAERLQHHRGRARRPTYSRPNEHVATGPNQVWSWDITYLRGPRPRQFFYLYVVMDVWSRKVVGWVVHDVESGDLAAKLVLKAYLAEGSPEGLVLHSDRGAPMTSSSLLALLEHLEVRPSYSRPRVSDDNPYSEALFRTAKYRPGYPSRPFASLAEASSWVADFVDWYNDEHRHSAIGFVTPKQRHNGEDVDILAARRAVYEAARRNNPSRWTGCTRAWSRPQVVHLNPSLETRQLVNE